MLPGDRRRGKGGGSCQYYARGKGGVVRRPGESPQAFYSRICPKKRTNNYAVGATGAPSAATLLVFMPRSLGYLPEVSLA